MPSQIDKSSLHDARVVGVMAILFGLLYIPAFIHGYFWLWVFPFTGIAALLFRSLLSDAIKKAELIEDSGKRSWKMSFELFGVMVTQVLVCSLPFICALWLSYILNLKPFPVSSGDQYLLDWALWFIPDPGEPEQIDFSQNYVVLRLSSYIFMFISFLAFAFVSFFKVRKARLFIFNAKKEKVDLKYGYTPSFVNVCELGIPGFGLLGLSIAMNEVINLKISIYWEGVFVFMFVFLSVFSAIYTMSWPFVHLRKVRR